MLRQYWWLWGLLALGTVGYCTQKSDVPDISDGPIPERFAGAYNSMGCENSSSKLASHVTVGGDSISYDSATFTVKEVVSESDRAVTLQGAPAGVGWAEGSRSFTMTYAPVGGTAMLNGSEYERCSQY